MKDRAQSMLGVKSFSTVMFEVFSAPEPNLIRPFHLNWEYLGVTKT